MATLLNLVAQSLRTIRPAESRSLARVDALLSKLPLLDFTEYLLLVVIHRFGRAFLEDGGQVSQASQLFQDQCYFANDSPKSSMQESAISTSESRNRGGGGGLLHGIQSQDQHLQSNLHPLHQVHDIGAEYP